MAANASRGRQGPAGPATNRFRNGVAVGDRIPDDMPLEKGDLILGPPPAPGPLGRQIAIVGVAFRDLLDKMYRSGEIEMQDNSEHRLRNAPGAARLQRGGLPGAGDGGRGGATGGLSFLCKDVEIGATEYWIAKGDWFPTAATEELTNGDVSFLVGDEETTYDGQVSTSTALCGAHAAGATSLLIGDADKLPPAPGGCRFRTNLLTYEGSEQAFASEVDGAHLAGDDTLAVKNVTGWPSSGQAAVELDDASISLMAYSAITPGVGTKGTLQLKRALRQNVAADNAVTMDRLTGVGAHLILRVTAERAQAATTLTVGEQDEDGEWVLADLSGVPSSGWLTVIVEDGPADGVRDYPGRRIPYTATPATGTITLAAPGLPKPVAEGAEVFIEGNVGLPYDLPSLTTLGVFKHTNVEGITEAVTRGAPVQFSDRYRNPLRAGTPCGVRAHDPWAMGRWGNPLAVMAARLLDDAWNGYGGGEQKLKAATVGPNSVLNDMIGYTGDAAGVIGHGAPNPPAMDRPWHVGSPSTRVAGVASTDTENLEQWNAATNQPPLSDATGVFTGETYLVSQEGTQDLGSGEIAFFEGDLAVFDGTVWTRVPEDQAGQSGSTTIYVRDNRKFPGASDPDELRVLTITAYNKLTGTSDEYDFTYDAAPKTRDEAEGLGLDRGDANIAFTGCARADGGNLSELHFNPGAAVWLSDTVPYAVVAADKGVAANYGKDTESLLDVVGPDGEAGLRLNAIDEDPLVLYRDSATGGLMVWVDGEDPAAPATSTEIDALQTQVDALTEPGSVIVVTKATDQTLTQSSTTLQNVTGLAFAVGANETWFVEVFLRLTAASNNSDFKSAWDGPAGATAERSLGATTGAWTVVASTSAPNAPADLTTASAFGSRAGASFSQSAGWFATAGTAGTFQLQMAQNTAQAENNTIRAGSFLRLTQLS